MPSADENELAKEVQSIIEKIYRQETASIESAMKLLDATRSDVIARIAEGGSEFNLSVLRQIERALEIRIDQFRRDLDRQMRSDLKAAFDLGTELADAPIKTVTQPLFGVSSELAQVAAEYSAKLITNLSTSMLTEIDGVLRRAALGGLSPFDAIKQVGRSLTDPSIFRSIAARAETIVRTEVLRMQAIASQARMKASADAVSRRGYRLEKQWLTAGDKRVRATHVLVNEQIRAVDEPFEVGGEALMYPRDPAGSAEETINCRCVSAPLITKAYTVDRERKFER